MTFDSDRPIETRKEDRLNRSYFAEIIARHIAGTPVKQGFTAAIVGQWGSGKTSLLNMVRESLEESGDDFLVLEFNPWLFATAEDLLPRFFSELSAQLGASKIKIAKQAAKAFAGLGQMLAPLSPVPGTGAVVSRVTSIVEEWAGSDSLLSQRNTLHDALAGSDSRIIVVVDDLDRLQRDETRELIRLIRLTSNLPNLIFLLAYDSERVAKSLDNDPAEGRNYLDKIVQLPFDVPKPRATALRDIVLNELDQLIQRHPHRALDRRAWEQIYFGVVEPLLDNLRDVKRYLNSIPVTLELVDEEVALADLLGIEALRVLRSSIFNELKANTPFLTFPAAASTQRLSLEARGVDIGKELTAMLERMGGEREFFDTALQILFPATQEYLRGTSYGSSQIGRWRTERRIACEEVLSVYLHAGIDTNAIPERDIQAILDTIRDGKEFSDQLDSLSEERLVVVLERLLDFGENLPVAAGAEAVPALVNQLGRLRRDQGGGVQISPRSKARQVIYRLLRRLQSAGTLESVLPDIMERVNSLSGQFCLIELVAHREAVERQLVPEEQARTMINQLVGDLHAATPKQLAKEWDLFEMVLRIGLRLDESGRLQLNTSLREHLDDHDFTVGLLRSALNTAYRNGHPQTRLFWNNLQEVFGNELVEAIHTLAQSDVPESLNEQDKTALDLALDYESGRRTDDLDDYSE